MLVGRDAEVAWLRSQVDEAIGGKGGVALLAGEAGVGKTRLVEEVAQAGDAAFVRGTPGPRAVAYGPIVAALRELARTRPDGIRECGPLKPHLALLLPELGDAVEASDRNTLFEAVRCGLGTAAGDRPAVVLLDDLHASDETTLELLAWLGHPLTDMPILIVGAYRSDEAPRSHPVRRLRDELRRTGGLRVLALEPLSEEGTAALASHVLGSPVAPELARALQDRTGGIPFFVEELAAALEDADLLVRADGRLELRPSGEAPVPETVRDVVLMRTGGLSDRGRASAEAAAATGQDFDLELMHELSCGDGLEELIARGLLVDRGDGRAAFRHPLVRDAVYEDVPWLRRRALHREIAAALEARGASGKEVADHWLAARDGGRALDALIAALDDLDEVHAYRDATRVGAQLLDLWPEGERGNERIAVLERHARAAELAGDFAEAIRAQREVVAARRSEGAGRALADAERGLGLIYGLKGERDRALAARQVAAEAYAANGLPAEAASERLVAAGFHHSAGRYEEAAALARAALEEAARAERPDLRARARGLEGVSIVKGGDFDEGVAVIREGLSLALEHEHTLVAAEVYQRLGTAYEIASDYAGARDALATAIGFCETGGGRSLEETCVSCMSYVLRELGDWDRSSELCRGLMTPGAKPDSTVVADGVLGSILAFRGDLGSGLPLLQQCLETATRLNVVSMTVDSAAALLWADEQAGDVERAHEHGLLLLERWSSSEDHHYAVWGLRLAASFFARHDSLAESRACADALSRIVAATGHPDAIAALAHALGEIALADGEAEEAAEQMVRAAEIHDSLQIPFERAQIQVRAGVALASAGRREEALAKLRAGYAGARALGAKPLATSAAAEVAALGESVEEALGKRAAADHENAGLSRREVEVIRMVATGQTNREIADELVLSTRTIDMHVRNILTKLGCRTRTEAAGRAGDLGLLA